MPGAQPKFYVLSSGTSYIYFLLTKYHNKTIDISQWIYFILFNLTIVLTTESGTKDMLSIFSWTKNLAKSGKSEGACPQIPTFLYFDEQL